MSYRHPIRDVKISFIIWTLPLLPFALAIGLAVVAIEERNAKIAKLTDLQALIDPIVLLSNAVHEQQKERGATAIVISSKGAEYTQELAKQRKESDARHEAFFAGLDQTDITAIDPDIARHFEGIRAKIAQVPTIRARVDALEISLGEALGFYTGLNADMLSMAYEVAQFAPDSQTTVAIEGFFYYLQAKERAGIERAVGSSGFASGSFPVAKLLRLKQLITEQETYFSSFRRASAPEIVAAFDAIAQIPESQKVAEMREVAFSWAPEGDLGGYTADDFFSAMTVRINQMKALEDAQTDALVALTGQTLATAQTSRNQFIIAIVAGGALAWALSFLVARSISSGFARLRTTAVALSEGDLDTHIPKRYRNEIGDIIGALSVLRDHGVENRDRARRDIEETREKAAAEREEQEREQMRVAQAAKEERAAHQAKLAEAEAERQVAAEIAAVVAACARGDFEQRLSTSNKSGTLLEISQGVNQVCEVIGDNLCHFFDAMEHLSNGDLTYQMDGEHIGQFADLQNRVNTTFANLQTSFATLGTSGVNIGGSTREFAQAARQLAARVEKTSIELEHTTESIKSLSNKVEDTAREATVSNSEATEAMDKVRAGNEMMATTISAFRDVKESSQAIGSAIKLIEDITFQTNLLALNAGVEAARAGEAGRGFAVVASEVRDLAQRSADAANEISNLLGRSEEQVDHSVGLVEQAGTSIQNIADAVSVIVGRIETIARSAQDQSNDIRSIRDATSALDQMTQANTAALEEASANSQTMQAEAEVLSREISAFTYSREPRRTQSASAA